MRLPKPMISGGGFSKVSFTGKEAEDQMTSENLI